jgi:SAM-dependent methyltransferase
MARKKTTDRNEGTLVKLNLGCGRDIRDGWINVDAVDLPGVDVVANLDDCAVKPLPFADNSVDEFLLSHLLEHISRPLPLMQELWRIAKPGAVITVRVPHGASDHAWTDPTHVRPYFGGSFGYFSQPFYFRADYGYRGDWQPTRTTYVVPREPFGAMQIPQILQHIEVFRNVVQEMIVEMKAVKPAREAKKELQVGADIVVRLAG